VNDAAVRLKPDTTVHNSRLTASAKSSVVKNPASTTWRWAGCRLAVACASATLVKREYRVERDFRGEFRQRVFVVSNHD
jgi:hypothetical protein